MKQSLRSIFVFFLLIISWTIIFAGVDFEKLRFRLKEDMVGNSLDVTDSNITSKINSISNNGKKQSLSFIRGDNSRSTLWQDLTFSSSADVTEAFSRIKTMALAYTVEQGELSGDKALLVDVISALEWMEAKQFSVSILRSGNWWDFVIGAPSRLNDILVLLKDELPQPLFFRLTNAIDYYTPSVDGYTGANLVWVVNVIGTRALLIQDYDKLKYARDSLLPALENITTGDGFYDDGSFIQHTAHPYNGAYGMSHLGTVVSVMYLFFGTELEIGEHYFLTIMNWIWKGFEPLVFNGALCSSVAGREVSRSASSDNKKGRALSQILLRLRRILPIQEKVRLDSYLKYMLANDPTYNTPYDGINSISSIADVKDIMNDPSIEPRSSYSSYKQYPSMDRMMVQRPSWAFGLAMHSTRIYNFEIVNNENLKGWHTGSGMTYLYNGDAAQYDLNFWPTVNPYRMPGTTVPLNKKYSKNSTLSNSFVGGTELQNHYGVSAFYMSSPTLKMEAKKSWFVFDNEVVALGSGIATGDNTSVNTYYEQRRLVTDNRNMLSIDNVDQTSTFGSTETPLTLHNPRWIYLQGKYTARGNIGYFFPCPVTLKAIRGRQSGTWADININGSSTVCNNYFFTLWQEHGISSMPSEDNASKYAYVLLPEMSKTAIATYAANPDIEILSQTNNQHAVREKRMGITGVVFWNNISNQNVEVNGFPYIACDKKSVLVVKEDNSELILAVSDPTQTGTEIMTIQLYVDVLSSIVEKSDVFTVISIDNPVRLTVDLKKTVGGSHEIRFQKRMTSIPSSLINTFQVAVVDRKLHLSGGIDGLVEVSINELDGKTQHHSIPVYGGKYVLPLLLDRGIYIVSIKQNQTYQRNKISVN